jgi:hypothetical protein
MNHSFYTLAYEAMRDECRRICAFTDALDKNPVEKKQKIAEYKCAKYRYAAVSLIESTIYNNHRCRTQHNLANFHHLLLPFDEMFKEQPDKVAEYDTLPAEEQPDYSLYHAIRVFTVREINKLEGKLPLANDWEAVELQERLGGLRFSLACLDEAWEKRGDADV